MKTKIINILIVILFLIFIFNFENILILFGKMLPYNYQENKMELNNLKNENKQLKEELNKVLQLNNLDKYLDYDYLKSSILLRNTYDFNNSIIIRYGKDKNIKKGMAVVNEEGLIGIINKVNKKSSEVKLITSDDINISIKIDENYGTLKSYDEDKKLLLASGFNNYEIIMKKDDVYTSGLGLIPEGLYIGNVAATKFTNSNIEQSVNISSKVNFNNLKYVAIIKGIKNV